MRAHVLLILLLIISSNTPAQTPFDSFASEAYRPMLGLQELKSIENGTQQAMPQDTAVIHDDDVSKWLSVDPMADKYPDISPYAYCNWNPIKFVDPDGRKIVVGSWVGRTLAKLGFNNFEAKVQSQLQELKEMIYSKRLCQRYFLTLYKTNNIKYVYYEMLKLFIGINSVDDEFNSPCSNHL